MVLVPAKDSSLLAWRRPRSGDIFQIFRQRPQVSASPSVHHGVAAVPCGGTPRPVLPKRIVVYGMNYAPELTGVGRFTGESCAHFAQGGAVIDVVTTPPHYPGWRIQAPYRRWYQTENSSQWRVTRCPILLGKKMRGVWRLLAPLSFAMSSAPVAFWRILSKRPDVVVVVEPTLFVAPVALFAAMLVGAKTALHVQDLEIDAAFAVGHLRGDFYRRLANWIESKILGAFDHVITISSQMRTRLEAKGVKPQHLSVVRNWVDLEKIKPLTGPNGFRVELGLTNETFVVLYAGSVGAKQGLPVMLDAAEQLKESREIVFVVAGDGPAKPDLIAQYAHLQNVRFLPTQPEDRLCELLNAADLHVLPQMRGAADLVLPSKLGGMLASGRHVLVTADPGTELYDFLSGAAVIVPAGDTQRMAEEISVMARDRPRIAIEKSVQLAAAFDSKRNLSAFTSILAGLATDGVAGNEAAASTAPSGIAVE